jgi:hypothetical protein
MLYRKTYGWNYTLYFVYYSFWVVKFTLPSRKFLLNCSQNFRLNRSGLSSVKLLSAAVWYNRKGFSCYLYTELWRGPHLDVCGKENCIIFMMTTWCPPKYTPSHTQELCSGASKETRGNIARPLRLDKRKTCECCRLLKTALFWDVTMSSVVEIHLRFIESYRLVLENVKIQRVNQPLFRPITGL